MKKILSLLAIMLGALAGYGQAPGILNYQGVARNSVGNVLVNKTINLRLTIRDGAAAGPTVYQESRIVTTNPFGLFNVQVGSPGAASVTGTIAGVNWAVGAKFIQVEIDPNGGTSFINIGTAQLASVPYSLFSTLAGDLVLPFNKTQADPGTLFKITNSNTTSAGATALEGLTNSTAGNANAIIGTVTSASPGGFSAGVRGINNGTGGLGIGVYGSQAGSGWGVYGFTPSGIGVNGVSTSGTGVWGSSTSGTGVIGTSSTGIAGLFVNTNAANTAPTLLVNTNITGIGLRVNQTGTGQVTGIYGNISTTTNGSAAVLGTDFSSGGASPVDSRTYGVLGQTGSTGIAVGGFASNGGTALRGSGGGATGYALNVTGRVQLTGINEALNRILTSDASGHATWQDPSLIGVVTGSGTLNFVPKWTPNGTNLGNSLLFDDGTRVGIATATPAYKLDVDATTGGGNGIRVRHTSSFATVDIIGVGNDQAIRFGKAGSLYSGINTLPDGDHINFFRFGGGQNLMSLNVNTGNFGVGGNPSAINAVAKVHVRGFNQVNNLYNPPSGFNGVTGVASMDDVNATGNEKWGIHTYVDGSTLINHSIFAVPGTTGLDNTGLFARVSSTPVGGGNSYGLYAFDAVNNGTSTWAANIIGRMRYADGTQGAGKILVSDGTGNASWSTTSAAGVVSGSGTLDYIPKWTPNGTTLGNSLVFDDGNRTQVGDNIIAGSSFGINPTPGSALPSIAWYKNATGQAFNMHQTDDGNLHVEANNTSAGAGTKIMTFDDDNLYVGIGTTTPTENLEINSGISFGGLKVEGTSPATILNSTSGTGIEAVYFGTGSNARIFFNQAGLFTNNLLLTTNSSGNTPDLSINKATTNVGIGKVNAVAKLELGPLSQANNTYTIASGFTGVTGFAVQDAGAVTTSKWGVYGFADGSSTNSQSGLTGEAGTTSPFANIGVFGRVSFAPTGSGSSAAFWALDAINGPATWAAVFRGRVQIQDGTQATGSVLTSDAFGNASWQSLPATVAFKQVGANGNLNVNAGTSVDINTWNVNEYNLGGGTYNAATGEYTVPVTGLYQVFAKTKTFGNSGTGFYNMNIKVNGIIVSAHSVPVSTNGIIQADANSAIQLNAGDLVKIEFQNSSTNNTTIPNWVTIDMEFSVNRIK
ncbi:MAG TPA: hypothetical protein PK092_01965 [Chitinophagaceae bacterium]|nr:hypothetical protein [Chitinophagaceae bacterium]